jgi:hypothetical protein
MWKRKRDPNKYRPWHDARRRTDVLRAYLDFVSACYIDNDLSKSLLGSWASFDQDQHFAAVDAWREAVAQQLMIPAPAREALDWKRRQDLRYLPVNPEEVARVIAADAAYLAEYRRRATDGQ